MEQSNKDAVAGAKRKFGVGQTDGIGTCFAQTTNYEIPTQNMEPANSTMLRTNEKFLSISS